MLSTSLNKIVLPSLLKDLLRYFLLQPVLHNWYNKCADTGIVYIKEPLLLIRKYNLWWWVFSLIISTTTSWATLSEQQQGMFYVQWSKMYLRGKSVRSWSSDRSFMGLFLVPDSTPQRVTKAVVCVILSVG